MSSAPIQRRDFWLFNAPVDLAAFLGSAALALLLLPVGAMLNVLGGDTPDWAWVPFVLLIDVAHVYATAFRVYFDPQELRRRWLLYVAVPICGLLIGVALYSEGESLFWRVLAYLAVFHFVRQQYGWVALYRAKLGERDVWGRWIDTAAIYLATVYPLVYWHAHLPRSFWWFLEDDFVPVPTIAASVLFPVYCAAIAAYAVKALIDWHRGRPNPGKHIVVATTALCWYVGIVAFNTDYAFTVTNVIIHGIPYIVLVFWYIRSRQAMPRAKSGYSRVWRTLLIFVSTLWLMAYVEELIWDRAIWHERSWLFGSAMDPGAWAGLIVPLLAVPQLTHYILDGFIWRRRNNPNFSLL